MSTNFICVCLQNIYFLFIFICLNSFYFSFIFFLCYPFDLWISNILYGLACAKQVQSYFSVACTISATVLTVYRIGFIITKCNLKNEAKFKILFPIWTDACLITSYNMFAEEFVQHICLNEINKWYIWFETIQRH